MEFDEDCQFEEIKDAFKCDCGFSFKVRYAPENWSFSFYISCPSCNKETEFTLKASENAV